MKKNNKMAAVLMTLLFGITLIMQTAAVKAADMPRIVDLADLLSDSEEAELSDRLDEISGRQQVDVVVVTVDSLEGSSCQEYADDFFDYNGYGFGVQRDGILFLISMEERDWCISTSGYGITAFTDAGLEYMAGEFLPYLSDGSYAEAFMTFAQMCDDYITQAETGTPYDEGNMPSEPFSPLGALLIALAVGFVTALIVTGVMRLGLHSVYSEPAADSYRKKDSLCLTREYELFLYRNVTRTERVREGNSSDSSGGSETHVSSSGRTHGGSSGKF